MAAWPRHAARAPTGGPAGRTRPPYSCTRVLAFHGAGSSVVCLPPELCITVVRPPSSGRPCCHQASLPRIVGEGAWTCAAGDLGRRDGGGPLAERDSGKPRPVRSCLGCTAVGRRRVNGGLVPAVCHTHMVPYRATLRSGESGHSFNLPTRRPSQVGRLREAGLRRGACRPRRLTWRAWPAPLAAKLRDPHLRVPDEHARFRAAGRPAGGGRLPAGAPTGPTPTWSSSTPAPSGRMPTTGSTGIWAICCR